MAGCAAHDGVVTVAQTYGTATYVLRGDRQRPVQRPAADPAARTSTAGCGPAAPGPDGFLWLGTVNKGGGTPVSSDDRVIRIQVGGGGARASLTRER